MSVNDSEGVALLLGFANAKRSGSANTIPSDGHKHKEGSIKAERAESDPISDRGGRKLKRKHIRDRFGANLSPLHNGPNELTPYKARRSENRKVVNMRLSMLLILET